VNNLGKAVLSLIVTTSLAIISCVPSLGRFLELAIPSLRRSPDAWWEIWSHRVVSAARWCWLRVRHQGHWVRRFYVKI